MPLVEPFQISSGTASLRRILLLETHDADGVTAWSECVAGEQPYYSPETVDTAWLAIREWIGPRVLGVPLAGPDAVLPRLDADLRGHLMAKAAVEMGVWGLAAERQGTSLASLIGGTRTQAARGHRSRPGSRSVSRRTRRDWSRRCAGRSRRATRRRRSR